MKFSIRQHAAERYSEFSRLVRRAPANGNLFFRWMPAFSWAQRRAAKMAVGRDAEEWKEEETEEKLKLDGLWRVCTVWHVPLRMLFSNFKSGLKASRLV